MSEWSLRPATREDTPRVVAIANRINPIPTTVAEFDRRTELRKQEGPYLRLVAEGPDGRIAGYGLVFRPVWRAEGVYFVHAAVDPDQTGQGAGRALYTALERQAREWVARALTTEVWDHRHGGGGDGGEPAPALRAGPGLQPG